MEIPQQPDPRRWFHFIISTYGSWPHGDPRGFRTRHHREHIEGDYKNPPPPGTYDDKLQRSLRSLKQAPVIFTRDWRPEIGIALKQKLELLGGYLLAIAVGGQHCHIQAKVTPGQQRQWRGDMKKHAWFEARDRGWIGQMWAKGGKEKPILNREHQENLFFYILAHRDEDAWVWTYRDPPC